MRSEHEAFIRCPVERVFSYMDDVTREKEWQPGILEARKDPPGPTALGTKKRYVSEFMGRRVENTYVTRVFEVNRHVVYETTPDSVLRGTAELRWEAGEDGTRVNLAFEGRLGGVLRFVPQRMLETVYQRELERSLRLLKERLEGST